MLKELKVVLSASVAKLKKGMRDAVSVTQTSAKQVNQAADSINSSMSKAFGGNLRGEINEINFELNETKQLLVDQKQDLKDLQKEQSKYVKNGKKYKELANSIREQKQEIGQTTNNLARLNAELRENKTNLANSRLAAEDNQSALESMSRTLTAVSSAVLLMDDSSESLRNTMKTLNFAFAAANAIVSINNLRLRENQLFMKASAAASALFSKATKTAAGSVSILKSSISALGIGALVTGLGYLINAYLESSSAAEKLADEQKQIRDVQKDAASNYIKEANEINALKGVIDNANKSLSEKRSAYRDLQKLVPSLTNLTLSQARSTGELTKQTYLQIEAIKAKNKAEAFSALLSKKQAELFDLQNAPLEESLTLLDKAQNMFLAFSKVSLVTDVEKNLNTQKAALRVEEKTGRLKELISKLQKEFEVSLENSLKFESEIFKFSQATTKSKEKQSKVSKQAVNEVSKSLIAEERIRAEQEKKFLQTEEEKVKATIASEERILAIKKSAILQASTAQNLSAAQVTELLKNLTFQEIKLQNDKSARIQAAINKDEKLKYDLTKKALEDRLALEDRITNESLSNLAKAYQNGLIDQETYELAKLQLQKEGLIARKKALELFGEDITKIEQKIADTQLKIQKKSNSDTVQNAEQTAINVGQVISREMARVGRQVADALSDAFTEAFEQTSEMAELDIEILKKQNEELRNTLQDSTKSQLQQLQAKKQLMENEAKILEKSQSGMSKLQKGFLMTIANFLEALGRGMIATGTAVQVAKKSLVAKPVVAIAAGAVALAAAAFVKFKIKQGPRFAEGGIVSGPTLGLVGEYPGASTNPEVIAPLDKLKNMLGATPLGLPPLIAETRVSGRDLAIILSRYEKDRTRG